ncbi:MAG: branched-chain amino acid ABC transporter permease, partial [Rhodobacteraceae bacterium]|nr:branched-chain amino acid ABC transporter permease [Paracoccaceae bacterium]
MTILGATVSKGAWAALAAAAAFTIAVPMAGENYLTGVGFSLFAWIALSQSWIVLSGMAGYISLGHVVFSGL